MIKNPKIINADISFDDRGEIVHCNNFDFKKNNIKRFYKIQNHNINFVRAWHGHKKENKFILILNGSLKICTVKIDNWKSPSKNLKKTTFFINEKKPQILFIPGGYAHGTQSLTQNTKFIVFSNLSVQDSIKDDFRFKSDYWGNWLIKSR